MDKESGKYHQPSGEREGEILPNKPGLTNPDEIHEAEAEGFARAELDAIEELTHETRFNASYIREIHRKALSHLYEFAGEYRSINMSKGGFMFAAAHVIPEAMKSFERDILLQMPHNYETRDQLVHDIGTVHAELLFIHPFREGNGRTMRILANLMAYKQSYEEINFTPVGKGGKMRKRYIASVQGAAGKNYQSMVDLMDELLPVS